VLSKQSMLYNQFRYLCEMRDLYSNTNSEFDGGFDSTFWKTNFYISVAKQDVLKRDQAGYGKKLGQPVWENTEYWRNFIPKHFPGTDTNRFMRLIQALDIPKPHPFPGFGGRS